jgi:hypothetical protein
MNLEVINKRENLDFINITHMIHCLYNILVTNE